MMKNNTFLETIYPMLLPFALVEVMIASIFSIYECPVPIPIILLGAGLVAVPLFALCRFTEKHRTTGGLLTTGVLLIAYIVMQYLMWSGYRVNYIMFQQWALTAGSETEDSTYYLWAMFLGGSVFFSVTIYYFSRVLYRMSFLMLISLLPCVLYAKVMTDIDNVYLILLAILNVGIFMVHRSELKRDGERRGKMPIIISSGVFILLVFLVCAVLPKETDARYYDRFEDAFLGGDTSTELGADFSDLGDYSGNADRFSNLGNRRLYSLYGENITYLKRQNFDYYDFEKDRWYAEEAIGSAYLEPESWSKSQSNLQLQKLQETMVRAEKLSPGFAQQYGVESIVYGEKVNDQYYNLHISALNFSAVYYLIPTRGVSVYSSDEEPFFATKSGTYRRAYGTHPRDFEYDVTYYDEFISRDKWLSIGGSNFTDSTEEDMLNALWRILAVEEDPYAQVAEDWYLNHVEALSYKSICAENNAHISDSVRELAYRITKDCTYDWEKALALQNYFHSNGFVYDLKYVAKDTSPEYFLFESKRGTCSDYASAYVLMARAVGLTVRYAEGYVPEFSSKDDIYYIKDSGSHAYPEVYLQGLGWTIFEPTTAAKDIYGAEDKEDLLSKLRELEMDLGLAGTIVLIGAIFIGLFLSFRLLLPLFLEVAFRIRIHFLAPNRCVLAVYKRIVRTSAKHGVDSAECMTPGELSKILLERGIDIEPLRKAVEKVSYGSVEMAEEQRKEAIAVYRKCGLRLRRKAKNNHCQ